LSTPHVKFKLGLDTDKGEIGTRYNRSEVNKGLKKVVEDLANKINVKDIYSKTDRIKYIDSIPENELPKITKPSQFKSFDSKPNLDEKIKRPKSTPPSIARSRLIPKECVLSIGDKRLNNIYHELKNISVDDFPNAVSVLFRVFLELSVDYLILKENLSVSIKGSKRTGDDALWGSLAAKIGSVSDFFEKRKIFNKRELTPIRASIQSRKSLVEASIHTLHEYVHNHHFNPVSTDLKRTWDNYEKFIKVIWS